MWDTIDKKVCANCSVNLNAKDGNLRAQRICVNFKSNRGQKVFQDVSVYAALSTVYNFRYLFVGDRVPQLPIGTETQKVIPLCLECTSLLTEMFIRFQEFSQKRQPASTLSEILSHIENNFMARDGQHQENPHTSTSGKMAVSSISTQTEPRTESAFERDENAVSSSRIQDRSSPAILIADSVKDFAEKCVGTDPGPELITSESQTNVLNLAETGTQISPETLEMSVMTENYQTVEKFTSIDSELISVRHSHAQTDTREVTESSTQAALPAEGLDAQTTTEGLQVAEDKGTSMEPLAECKIAETQTNVCQTEVGTQVGVTSSSVETITESIPVVDQSTLTDQWPDTRISETQTELPPELLDSSTQSALTSSSHAETSTAGLVVSADKLTCTEPSPEQKCFQTQTDLLPELVDSSTQSALTLTAHVETSTAGLVVGADKVTCTEPSPEQKCFQTQTELLPELVDSSTQSALTLTAHVETSTAGLVVGADKVTCTEPSPEQKCFQTQTELLPQLVDSSTQSAVTLRSHVETSTVGLVVGADKGTCTEPSPERKCLETQTEVVERADKSSQIDTVYVDVVEAANVQMEDPIPLNRISTDTDNINDRSVIVPPGNAVVASTAVPIISDTQIKTEASPVKEGNSADEVSESDLNLQIPSVATEVEVGSTTLPGSTRLAKIEVPVPERGFFRKSKRNMWANSPLSSRASGARPATATTSDRVEGVKLEPVYRALKGPDSPPNPLAVLANDISKVEEVEETDSRNSTKRAKIQLDGSKTTASSSDSSDSSQSFVSSGSSDSRGFSSVSTLVSSDVGKPAVSPPEVSPRNPNTRKRKIVPGARGEPFIKLERVTLGDTPHQSKKKGNSHTSRVSPSQTPPDSPEQVCPRRARASCSFGSVPKSSAPTASARNKAVANRKRTPPPAEQQAAPKGKPARSPGRPAQIAPKLKPVRSPGWPAQIAPKLKPGRSPGWPAHIAPKLKPGRSPSSSSSSSPVKQEKTSPGKSNSPLDSKSSIEHCFIVKEKLPAPKEISALRPSSTSSPFRCPSCMTSVYSSQSYVSHVEKHLLDKRFSCHKCPYVTSAFHRFKPHCEHHHSLTPVLGRDSNKNLEKVMHMIQSLVS